MKVIKAKDRTKYIGKSYLCGKCYSDVTMVESYCWNCGEELEFDHWKTDAQREKRNPQSKGEGTMIQ